MLIKFILTTLLLALFHLKLSLADLTQCEEGYLCIWTEESYGGEVYKFDENEKFWKDSLDENDSSWANFITKDTRTDNHVLIFNQDSFKENIVLCLKPG
ncbi:unnamed protein product [Cunninghamella echinulata]